MTINERLALMDEIARKNDLEWSRYKRKPRPACMHPLAAWALKCLFTFCAVILMGIVALNA